MENTSTLVGTVPVPSPKNLRDLVSIMLFWRSLIVPKLGLLTTLQAIRKGNLQPFLVLEEQTKMVRYGQTACSQGDSSTPVRQANNIVALLERRTLMPRSFMCSWRKSIVRPWTPLKHVWLLETHGPQCTNALHLSMAGFWLGKSTA